MGHYHEIAGGIGIMAGVYIKGMDKPKECRDCPFNIGVCAAKVAVFGKKPLHDSGEGWCPLVEVPDHGDLIDKSEKVDALYYEDKFGGWSIKTKTVGEVLAEMCQAPPKVVIPAEREERKE